ncbi:MAG: hypothetical protein NVS1B13_23240 [Flavisolibacter sp.]
MKKLLFSVFIALYSLVGFSQDKDINVNVNTKDGSWYTSPWVWIVGAAVFILLLVAIARGGGKKGD